ncbi:cupin domain-containing protein [Actinomadura rugatobispora]|uniref:Cupin domain-containing protein n=1 Tax=Actinomadura rugatobispora TaxID=1994 RepID=A0ABW0ZVU1_9ACTN|nr:cupin domain-containing protein [Actinomadura rugatobispora]
MAQARIVRGGEGRAYGDAPWLFKATGDDTGGRFDFMVGEVAYLSGPSLHTHDEQHDTFYVLDGVLTVQAGEEVFELRPGDFVTFPPGVPHTFDNVREDQGPVRAINVMTPGGLHEFFAAAADPALGEADLAETARRFGTRAGPTLGVRLGLAEDPTTGGAR